jgi:hypothetical protein
MPPDSRPDHLDDRVLLLNWGDRQFGRRLRHNRGRVGGATLQGRNKIAQGNALGFGGPSERKPCMGDITDRVGRTMFGY